MAEGGGGFRQWGGLEESPRPAPHKRVPPTGVCRSWCIVSTHLASRPVHSSPILAVFSSCRGCAYGRGRSSSAKKEVGIGNAEDCRRKFSTAEPADGGAAPAARASSPAQPAPAAARAGARR